MRVNRLIIIIGLILMPALSWAANWHVLPTSQGSNNGTDWSNAWSLTSIAWGSVAAGDSIFLGGGTYDTAVWSIGASGASGNPITIRRATSSSHGSATGWSPAYDAQVIFINSTIPRVTGRSWITMTGVVTDGWVIRPDSTSIAGAAACWRVESTSSNITIEYLFCDGINQNPSVAINGMWCTDSTNVTVSRSKISNTDDDPFLINNNCDGALAEYNVIGPRKDTLQHGDVVDVGNGSDNFTFRYNIANWDHQMIWGTGNSVYVYGNIFYEYPIQAGTGHISQVFKITSGTDCRFYNNAIINVDQAFPASLGCSGEIKDNIIFWSGTAPTINFGSLTHDYNWFSGASNFSETNGIAGGSVDPFIDRANFDFHIVGTISATYPRDEGVNLGAPYNVDRDGNTRGSDGLWDIGAYERQGSGYTLCPSGCNASTMAAGFALLTQPGDTLTATQTATYSGTVSTVASGTQANPIRFLVTGGQTATFTGELNINHDWIQINSLVVDTSTAATTTGAIECAGNNCTLDTIQIKNTNSRGFQCVGVSGCTIKNSTIYNVNGPSIHYLNGSTNGLIENNDISYIRGEDVFRIYGNTHTIRLNNVHHIMQQETYAEYIQWAPSTAYNVYGEPRVPTVNNGFVYAVHTRGTSGGTEPTWPTTLGATVTDGTVTWRCAAQVITSGDPHTDLIQMDTSLQGDYHTITFERNKVTDFYGAQLWLLDCNNWGQVGYNCNNIVFRNNLFIRTRAFGNSYVPTYIYSNTFHYTGYGNNPYAIVLNNPTVGRGDASGSEIKNNIFSKTGTGAGNGYVSVNASLTNITRNYNLVFQDVNNSSVTKSGFSETNGINGSNPSFTTPSDDYSASDNYTLSSSSSPAYNAGTTIASFSNDYAGTTRPQSTAWDIGAYELSATTSTFTLSITTAGTGYGTVMTSVGPINCSGPPNSGTCSNAYNENTVVTLLGTPASGSDPVAWSGDADCSDGSVTMSAARNCTSTFNLTPPPPPPSVGSHIGRSGYSGGYEN